MFGIRYLKSDPTQHVLQMRDGKAVRDGLGLSFFYYAPSSSIVLVPTASADDPFMVEETTADFQTISVQGQVSYRVSDPKRLAQMMNYSLNARGQYASEDPRKLGQRVLDQVQVLMRSRIQALRLDEALSAGDRLSQGVAEALAASAVTAALGLTVLGLSVLAVRP